MSSDGAESAPSKLGQICWLEIPVKDWARAAEFYRAVFDWECKEKGFPSPLAGIKTVSFFSKGDLNGAFLTIENPDDFVTVAREPGSSKGPVLASYSVEDVDGALEKVKQAGGRIIIPKTMLGAGMGAFARFEDTEGNLQGVWGKQ